MLVYSCGKTLGYSAIASPSELPWFTCSEMAERMPLKRWLSTWSVRARSDSGSVTPDPSRVPSKRVV